MRSRWAATGAISLRRRARVKIRARLYELTEELFGFGRADLLASYALFDNDPAAVNRLESELMKVTPELIQQTAVEYLRPTNRTILTIEPKAAEDTPASKSGN